MQRSNFPTGPNTYIHTYTHGVLTGAVIICVTVLCPPSADTQEGFVVIVFIPVKGGDSGESPLSVAAYKAGGGSHHFPERQTFLEERSHDLDELPEATLLEQLQRDKKNHSSFNKQKNKMKTVLDII